jgi:hypothetical protein
MTDVWVHVIKDSTLENPFIGRARYDGVDFYHYSTTESSVVKNVRKQIKTYIKDTTDYPKDIKVVV